jgi:hypothetical protein
LIEEELNVLIEDLDGVALILDAEMELLEDS